MLFHSSHQNVRTGLPLYIQYDEHRIEALRIIELTIPNCICPFRTSLYAKELLILLYFNFKIFCFLALICFAVLLAPFKFSGVVFLVMSPREVTII